MGARKAVNLTIDAKLLDEARAEKLQLSAVAERALRAEISRIRAERWKRENAEAIRHNNEELERNGVWTDRYRLF